MAQFKPFDSGVEVNGMTVIHTIKSLPVYVKEIAAKILKKHGINNPKANKWYSLKAWLEAFEEISRKFGPDIIFELGKTLPEIANFPFEKDSIDKSLKAINLAYKSNHRNGEIGYYKLVQHDIKNKSLIMQCKNPYPCEYDRGIITTMARKVKCGVVVTSDCAKPTRKEGHDESWYIVSYA